MTHYVYRFLPDYLNNRLYIWEYRHHLLLHLTHPSPSPFPYAMVLCIEFKEIEGVLRRKQRIASQFGFPLELAVCDVSHLLSPAMAEKTTFKRNIYTVRKEDYTLQDVRCTKKHAQLAATLQISQFKSDTLQTMGYSLSTLSIFFLSLWLRY